MSDLPASMRAVRYHGYGGPDALRVEEVSVPPIGPSEVLVRTAWAGVNPVDWKTRSGRGMAGLLGDPRSAGGHGVGWDVAGTVAAIGSGVTRLEVGDRVAGLVRFPAQAAAYAEYVSAPTRHLVRVPETVGLDHAAGLPLAGLTAWQMLVDTAGVAPGDRVMVIGAAGGVGHLAVQVARHLGAQVVAVTSTTKLEIVRDLGADVVIDRHTQPLTAAGPVDIVIDAVGGDYLTTAREVLQPNGLLLTAPSGPTEAQFVAAEAVGVRLRWMLVEPDRADTESLMRLYEDGHLRCLIAERRPLEQAGELHRIGEQGRTIGKLLVEIGGG